MLSIIVLAILEFVKMSEGVVVNEMIEGVMNIEKIHPVLRYSIDFSSNVSIEEYTLNFWKNETAMVGFFSCEFWNGEHKGVDVPIRLVIGAIKDEMKLKIPSARSGVIKCEMNYVGFVKKKGQTKKMWEEYRMRFEGNLCPMTPYQTNMCIMDVRCLSSQIIGHSLYYETIQTNDINMVRFVVEEYQGGASNYFYVDFYSRIDPIIVKRVEKEVMIKNDLAEVTERYIEMQNCGEKVKGGFVRLEYEKSEKDCITFNKMMLKFKDDKKGTATAFDSTGLIDGVTVSYRGEYTVAFITPRYPLFGGWSATLMVTHSITLESEDINTQNGSSEIVRRVKIPLITTTNPLAVVSYEIVVKFPVGTKVSKFYLLKNTYGTTTELNIEEYLLGLFDGPVIKVVLSNVVTDANTLDMIVDYVEGDMSYKYFTTSLIIISVIFFLIIINYLTYYILSINIYYINISKFNY
ncbi:hypothetical protein EIN_182430 [Entamoeba invadens IP1]|uniref:hypothetical protein n=1 Tax=Entamoeba invadens IP1 TaxID=370355 RepID=UPI0002C3E8A0|nr:hypothetical protein EIN_182430 [Entamoeba invadens IP1]ELP94016.1 hypothetical protein EIN_182430 [Entamoeba invadens IP1]|eukprot:XP_004260787.1 hypothetical protein EIN_182430 [Entamoeba invadens IP1]